MNYAPLEVWNQGEADTAAKSNLEVEAVNKAMLALAGFESMQTLGGTAVAKPAETIRPNLFVVTLETTGGQTSGTNGGDQSTQASWTYTAFLPGSEDTIGEDLEPTWGRSNGKVNSASIGLAYYDTTGTLQLLIANELPGTGGCGV